MNEEKPLTLKEAKRVFVTNWEKGFVERLLERHRGNVTRAAREAGVGRCNFHRLLARHGIVSQRFRVTDESKVS